MIAVQDSVAYPVMPVYHHSVRLLIGIRRPYGIHVGEIGLRVTLRHVFV